MIGINGWPRMIAIVRLEASDCCLVSAEALNIVSLGRVHANGMLVRSCP